MYLINFFNLSINMSIKYLAGIIAFAFSTVVVAHPIDDYVDEVEPAFGWEETGVTFRTILGGHARVLNVTSLQFFNETYAQTPGGPIWTHQVVIITPRIVETKDFATVWLGQADILCNDKNVTKEEEDILIADQIAWNTNQITVAVFMDPNCPMVYSDDPSQRKRREDSIVAWSLNEYLKYQDPKMFIIFPMVKAAFQIMKAVQQNLDQTGEAQIKEWFVSGISKRGWTTWMIAATNCTTCVKLAGILPLSPIVPNLLEAFKWQWQSYDGFSFAILDYVEIGLMEQLDNPIFIEGVKLIDPAYFIDQIAKVPVLSIQSSDDEFMMFDWT